MPWCYLLAAVLGYLLGSFPTGYLVGRSRGIDIRAHGSGNIGATNVVRVLGKKPGYFVFFCDALKGLLAVRCGIWLIYHAGLTASQQLVRDAAAITPSSGFKTELVSWNTYPAEAATVAGIIAAIGCILGHNFPVWLKFRGGKGVATTVGVLLGLMPAALGVSAVVWVVSFYTLRYVSLASLLGAAALPVAVWFLTIRHPSANHGTTPLFWFSVVAAALIFWRHRANIQRLLNGTEARFARKTPPPAPPAV